ncbi:MAG: ABC transporter permease [bacterium]|nr:ABC transporter permease [bacterium]
MSSTLHHDLRIGLRMLLGSPLTTLAIWLSLSLGIGSLTAIFSVVNGLLLQPLPYAESQRLVLIWEDAHAEVQRQMGGTSDATFEDWRREARSFESLSALGATSRALTSVEVPESLFTRPATASHFRLLGIEPALGRSFTEQEERQGANLVIVSHEVWQRLFGGDPEIVGRKVELDDEPWEVIGVMPAGYHGPIEPAPVQLWIPIRLNPENRRQWRLLVYGRLAEGVPPAAAAEEMSRIADELRGRHPKIQGSRVTRVRPVQEVLVGRFRPELLTVFGAGVFLLLIVCGNVANLLLARALTRHREMAVRTALGARPSHLLRQLVMENLILSLAAAAAGIGLAVFALAQLRLLVPVQLGLPRLDGVAIDARVALFTLAVTLVVALIFGLVPARLALSRTDLNAALGAGGVRTTSRHGRLLRPLLVIIEVSLSLILLIGTGLMVQTFLNLGHLEAGHDPAHLLTLRTALRGPDYQDAGARIRFFQRTGEAIVALPGVRSAAATDLIFFGIPRGGTRFTLEGTETAAPGSEPEALLQVVTPGYFDTIGAPLLQGRPFDDHDTGDAVGVAIVNRRFLATYLESREPIGQEILSADGSQASWTIVGVVGDLRTFGNPPDPMPTIYVPHAQRPASVMTTVVRTVPKPQSLVRSVQAAITRLDRLMPTYGVATLDEARADADWQARFSVVLLAFFAALALILGLIGIYAVIASGVAERSREFGIRISFGARPGHILAHVLGRSLWLAGLGILIGVVTSALLSRLLETQVYGVTATDPATYVGLSLLLGAAVMAASCVPALRAMRVDPITVLREE